MRRPLVEFKHQNATVVAREDGAVEWVAGIVATEDGTVVGINLDEAEHRIAFEGLAPALVEAIRDHQQATGVVVGKVRLLQQLHEVLNKRERRIAQHILALDVLELAQGVLRGVKVQGSQRVQSVHGAAEVEYGRPAHDADEVV